MRQLHRGRHRSLGQLVLPQVRPGQARVVLILAAVLGLNGADQATVSATADNLKQAFQLTNTDVGLLVTVVALAGAAFTLPVGVLTDRTRRTRLLALSIAAWSVATFFSGAALSYPWLLISRTLLGAVAATSGPTVASLTGDYFPAADRARVYGLILGGDLVGTGAGFILSGDISSALNWRFSFWWLVLPSLALAWAVWRLPEPARGAQRRLSRSGGDGPRARELAGDAIQRTGSEPDPSMVLRTSPAGRSLWWAIGYVLRVRTNLVIIGASALAYFFFAGLRSFAIIYATGHYGVTKPVANALLVVVGAGALGGVFAGGRVSDRLLRRGHIRARLVVPLACLLAAPPVLAAAIATSSVAIAVPLLTAGAFLLSAPNPPLDAARLDIMHPQLWGRAEGVRTALRTLGEASAPVLFGLASVTLFGGPGAAAGGPGGTGSAGSAGGLEYTFLMFLIPLLGAGLLLLPALRTYPRDVATATASAEAISHGSS
ncbi:MAG: MFS transporter [Actinobacteria bacterium]|nr:MFS transporter [Actinomycetota bacterium]